MLRVNNPHLDSKGPWVRTIEVCVPGGTPEENRLAQTASRFVNDWLYTFCVVVPRVQRARGE
ncbi:MAG: hypothetical protein EP334_10190 [Gammaproteobacteria bacterium]|nr:MAG: hypothetical protein EP334_10190 [Gammaproteobacteria bacterium]